LVIPQLQLGDNVIPQLVNIIKTVKGWDAFSTFKSHKSSSHLFDISLSPGVEGVPSQKLYLKHSTVEFFLDGGDAFSMFKLQSVVYLTTMQ
jgi:hypothetical protein